MNHSKLIKTGETLYHLPNLESARGRSWTSKEALTFVGGDCFLEEHWDEVTMTRLGELVAQNRGVDAHVFSGLAAAKKWLLK
jgi:hypothetical protein